MKCNLTHLQASNENESKQGIAKVYTEVIESLKDRLEDCVKSVEGAYPRKMLNFEVLEEISCRIKSAASRLQEMVLNAVCDTNACFLKQGIIL